VVKCRVTSDGAKANAVCATPLSLGLHLCAFSFCYASTLRTICALFIPISPRFRTTLSSHLQYRLCA
jgi:hypothetical protein